MIICRTPMRISFFGGGTDFPKWYLENEGLVISTSIDKYCYVTCRFLPNIFDYNYRLRYFFSEEVKNIDDIKHPSFREVLRKYPTKNNILELVHNADLPAMSGLGSSSSSTVSAINALNALLKKKISKEDLAKEAINIEQNILRDHVGSQDQIIASYGGFNLIEFKKNKKFIVKPITNQKNINSIESSMLLIYTGLQRKASAVEKDKLINFKKNEKYYKNIYDITKHVYSNIVSKNFDLKNFGKLLSEQWKNKKGLSKFVTNKIIDEIYDEGMRLGASGGKLLGAGNGGFLLFICDSKSKLKISKSLKNFFNTKIKFSYKGSEILKIHK